MILAQLNKAGVFPQPCEATVDQPGRSVTSWRLLLLLDSRYIFFFFFFTLVAGPRRSLSLGLSDTRVCEPQIRARLVTTAHFCEVVTVDRPGRPATSWRLRHALRRRPALSPCVHPLILKSISLFFFFFTLVTGPRRSLSLELSDTGVCEPQIRVRLVTASHFCEVITIDQPRRRATSWPLRHARPIRDDLLTGFPHGIRALTPLTPNTAEHIPTLGALSPRGGPVLDPVLTLQSIGLCDEPHHGVFDTPALDIQRTTKPNVTVQLTLLTPRTNRFKRTLPPRGSRDPLRLAEGGALPCKGARASLFHAPLYSRSAWATSHMIASSTRPSNL